MSKILRRPMFRGGPVDSRGTGITSGLMDGGRVGYQSGNLVLGGDLLKKNQPNLSTLANTRFSAGMPFAYELPAMNNQSIEEVGKVEDVETDDRGFLQKAYDMFNPSRETIEKRLKERSDDMTTFDEKMENIGIVTNQAAQNKALEDAEKIAVGGREDPDAENARIQQENYEKNQKSQLEKILSGNVEESTEAGIEDIKAQAELFKEILSADNKKKLKDARISDASDYLLKFFEGSQREGATVGSAAADVAAFATSKDSKTERAKAAIEKTDQTASALAINDYISGKKSKAEIAKMMKLAEYRSDLAAERGKKNVGEYIMSSKELGFSNKVKEGVQAKYGPRVFEEVTSEIMSDSTKFKPDESDIGKVYIETDTKTVYTFDKNGNRIPIYQG
jgi:hypothetical protein